MEDAAEEEPQWTEETLEAAPGGHYGNPAHGCLPDEDVIFLGSGHTCAPRIGTTDEAPPTPKCKVGGVAPSRNGCPADANRIVPSKAWPICLAKGNGTDPY